MDFRIDGIALSLIEERAGNQGHIQRFLTSVVYMKDQDTNRIQLES